MLQSNASVPDPCRLGGLCRSIGWRREHAIPCWSTTQGSAPFRRLRLVSPSSCQLMIMRWGLWFKEQRHAIIERGVRDQECTTIDLVFSEEILYGYINVGRSTEQSKVPKGTPHSTAKSDWAQSQI